MSTDLNVYLQWLSDPWHCFLAVMFVREFMNNLLKNTPSLKSNSVFECIYNTLDAFVSTVKGFGKKGPNEPGA
jgi:hypothetical protein